jgi:hypothetical protein
MFNASIIRTMTMEAVNTSETSVSFYKTTHSSISEKVVNSVHDAVRTTT